jgi:hypothetical protein
MSLYFSGVLCFFLIAYFCNDDNFRFNRPTYFAAFVSGILFVIVLLGMFDAKGIWYKKGQIDALTNQIKYERISHPDSTITWEKINESDKR